MAATDLLLNNARVRCPGALDDALKQELLNVIDEFCRGTHAWRDAVTVDIAAGQDLYTPAFTADPLIIYGIGHPTLDVTGAVYDDGTIVLPNVPTAIDAINPLAVDAAWAPFLDMESDADDWLPAGLWTRYHDCLLDGLCSRMMLQPAKPYTSATLAIHHGRRFRAGMSAARYKARAGVLPNAVLWRFPRFA